MIYFYKCSDQASPFNCVSISFQGSDKWSLGDWYVFCHLGGIKNIYRGKKESEFLRVTDFAVGSIDQYLEYSLHLLGFSLMFKQPKQANRTLKKYFNVVMSFKRKHYDIFNVFNYPARTCLMNIILSYLMPKKQQREQLRL